MEPIRPIEGISKSNQSQGSLLTQILYENYWQKRATREWALRPEPIWTIVKGLNTWQGFKSAVSAGLQTLSFIRS